MLKIALSTCPFQYASIPKKEAFHVSLTKAGSLTPVLHRVLKEFLLRPTAQTCTPSNNFAIQS